MSATVHNGNGDIGKLILDGVKHVNRNHRIVSGCQDHRGNRDFSDMRPRACGRVVIFYAVESGLSQNVPAVVIGNGFCARAIRIGIIFTELALESDVLI